MVFNEYIYMYAYTCICQNSCLTWTPPILGRNRKLWTKSQTEILTRSFQANVYPERTEVLQLAKSFNLSAQRVENWFGTMRRRERKQGTLTLPEGELFSVAHYECSTY